MIEKTITNNLTYHFISNGSFRIISPLKTSRTLEFFDDLYSYPPKFRIKWDNLDELQQDCLNSNNFQKDKKNNSTFLKILTDIFLNEKEEQTLQKNYSLKEYITSYKNKLILNQIYTKNTKKLQDALKSIPVYVVLNGQGDIILSESTDLYTSNTSFLTDELSRSCGIFDPIVENKNKLGLFFLSKNDAEIYLQEIASLDSQGTQSLGLSLHCLGLDFAYRVMRSYDSRVDFRFVPDLSEVQTVLKNKTLENPNIIVEDEQQQLRLRYKNLGLPIIWRKKDYFKGVPIYIVKIEKNTTNNFTETYFFTLRLIDNFLNYFVHAINIPFGLGNNFIKQGSFNQKDNISSQKVYLFFEKKAALDFCKNYKYKNIFRYKKDQFTLLNNKIKKPQILLYNLEDFLENWEEKNIENQEFFSSEKVEQDLILVPTKSSTAEVNKFFNEEKIISKQKIIQFLVFKYKRLTSFINLTLNTN